ncbi:ankyrin repeat-containing protein-like protein [Salvia divinorum]|uniref:Ankyrin repeat-containing protein-like protein n=1 Tax=Salvia divinorum TaxID=28513 RepID=A0ABD1HP07_SALDI
MHGQHSLFVNWIRNPKDLVNAIDEDGETILHLAVRANQLETIRYLVESKKIKRRTQNSTGKTPLQILNASPWYTSTSYSEIRRSLLKLLQPSLDSVMPEMTNSTMVVVVLITTMAFQNAVNPSGGMCQEDTSSHKAGDVVIAYTHPHIYKHLVCANIVAFVSSILSIFLIATGLTSRNIFLLNIALFGMWVSLIAIAVSYGASTMVITPITKTKSVHLIAVIISLISLISFLVSLLFVHLAMMYFSWRGKIRGREDLITDPLPKRILYQIFQRLETWGCLRTHRWSFMNFLC